MNNSPIAISNHFEFEQAFRRGLGRAVLCLQDGSVTPDRDFIIHACTHDLRYDSLEDNRALYLSDIIAATGEPDFYTRHIEEALNQKDEEQSVSQMFGLLALRAKAGDAMARRSLYAYFEANAAETDTGLAEALIDLDGLDGYLFAIRQWVIHPRPEDDHWHEAYYLEQVEKRFGPDTTQTFLLNTEPAVVTYVAEVAEKRVAWKARQKRPIRPQPSIEELRQAINSQEKRFGPMVWARWGKDLNTADAERLASELLAETDPERMVRYLDLFGRRSFPFDHRPLLDLARGSDEKVAAAAMFALAQITDPSIHDLALEKIASPRPWESLELLVRNYQNGDSVMIERILDKPWNPDELHWITLDLRKIFKANPSPDAARALTRLYELGFCTLCRQDVVERLAELGPLPPWMIDECRYDAYEGTRQLTIRDDH